jgi:UDP-glucose 4-epimerase
MKVVITGALGHIGSRLVRDLPYIYPEVKVIMIDNMVTQRYCSLFNLPDRGEYRFVEMDVTSDDLLPIVDGVDVVIHLAAITDATSSFQNREQVEKVNYNATVQVAKACEKKDCPMIFISSTSVYGTQAEIVDEDCSAEELKPQSPYAETKLKEEKFLQVLASSGKLRFVICRFGTIAGVSPGMRFHTAVNKFCWQAVMGQSLSVWQTALHQKRPYLALDDAIRALAFIIENSLFEKSIYNVLTENLTVNSIIKFIEKHIPHLDIQYVNSEIMNQLSYEVSNLRFKNQGFEFKGSVEKSIGETIELLKGAKGIHEL